MLEDKLRGSSSDARRGLHGRRQLLPDAHRRRAAQQRTGVRSDAPGRDPGGHGMSFPSRGARGAADAQLRRNLGKATTTIRAKRAAAVAELADWEALREAGAAIKARAMATLPEQLERLEAAVHARAARCTGRATRARPTRSSRGSCRRHGAREVIKVKSLATDEIELNDALAQRGIKAIETDLAELIIQLAGDSQSHILVPAIHRNRAEIRALFERTIARARTSAGRRPAIAEAAREHLRDKFLRSRWRSAGANFGDGRDRHDLRGRVRGQRAHVHDAARGARHRDGHREGAARVARPRGLPPAAAALLDRRADEPVHLAVDRGPGRRRPAGVPPRAARQRPHATCWPTRSAARRCTASAARRA